MMNGDRAIGPLFKILLVICVLMTFGMVLNGITSSHERKLSEQERSVGVRISLIREEYERKLSDLKDKAKFTCDQKVSEVVSYLKRTAKESQDKLQFEHSIEIKNKTDQITKLKSLLGGNYANDAELSETKPSEKLDAIAAIEKELADIKKRLLGQEKESKSDNAAPITEEEAKYYIADKKLLEEVTKKLDKVKENEGKT